MTSPRPPTPNVYHAHSVEAADSPVLLPSAETCRHRPRPEEYRHKWVSPGRRAEQKASCTTSVGLVISNAADRVHVVRPAKESARRPRRSTRTPSSGRPSQPLDDMVRGYLDRTWDATAGVALTASSALIPPTTRVLQAPRQVMGLVPVTSVVRHSPLEWHREDAAALPRHRHGACVGWPAAAVSGPVGGCPASLRVGRILGMPRWVTQRRNKTIATTTDAAGSTLPSRI